MVRRLLLGITIFIVRQLKRFNPGLQLPLFARPHYSGFDDTRNPYNSISVASDGKVYYILSTDSLEVGGQMYVYDPKTDTSSRIADLNDVCGETGYKVIPQGKSHTSFYEKDETLYFSTHVSVYEVVDGAERFPKEPPEGFARYPGGHFLSYDLNTGEFEDLAKAPEEEGILTMTMDVVREHLYGLTWPSGYFLHYDIKERKLHNLGLLSEQGEAGTPGKDFRVICRAMFVDPKTGQVYFSTGDGDICYFSPGNDSVEKIDGVDLRRDYFGDHDPSKQGSMAYNWRQILWHPEEEVAYGVHGGSGYLFRFDPRKPRLDLIERITSLPSKRCGMYDQFCFGYLGFDLAPDQETLYYLTGGPLFVNGKRLEGNREITIGARGLENVHLVTYNIKTSQYRDHGPVLYEYGGIPTYVNSLAVGADGMLYTLARQSHGNKVVSDLVKIPDPLFTSDN